MSEDDKEDPYSVLGVDPKATTEEIKRAYRKGAKDNHPDHGGSDKAFSRLSKAYGILSNPVSRNRYDTTGKMEEDGGSEPLEVKARKIIITIVFEVINSAEQAIGNDPARLENIDVLGTVKALLGENLKTSLAREGVRANKKKLARFQKLAVKLKKKKSVKVDFLGTALSNQIRTLEKSIAAQDAEADAEVALFTEALKLLQGYSTSDDFWEEPILNQRLAVGGKPYHDPRTPEQIKADRMAAAKAAEAAARAAAGFMDKTHGDDDKGRAKPKPKPKVKPSDEFF